jgi:hypothetical protein
MEILYFLLGFGLTQVSYMLGYKHGKERMRELYRL